MHSMTFYDLVIKIGYKWRRLLVRYFIQNKSTTPYWLINVISKVYHRDRKLWKNWLKNADYFTFTGVGDSIHSTPPGGFRTNHVTKHDCCMKDWNVSIVPMLLRSRTFSILGRSWSYLRIVIHLSVLRIYRHISHYKEHYFRSTWPSAWVVYKAAAEMNI